MFKALKNKKTGKLSIKVKKGFPDKKSVKEGELNEEDLLPKKK